VSDKNVAKKLKSH